MIAYSLLALRFKACVDLLNLQSINKCYKGHHTIKVTLQPGAIKVEFGK